MPKAKRERRERTDNYHRLLEWCRTPEQRLYEGIRPITLFGVPPAERAQETGLAESSLRRAADAFDTQGMISLFRPSKAQREDHHRSLPVLMRQLIVDLKAEYPDFTLGEIAAICAIQFAGRRPTAVRKKIGPLKFNSSGRSIATMGEPTRSIRCRYSSKGILKRFLQRLTGSRSDATQDCLHLRKSLFNGRKIWRISWQKQQLTASRFDELPHLVSLMDA